MAISNLLPPDNLIKVIPKMGVIKLTNNYSNYVLQQPQANISTTGIKDEKTIGEIVNLEVAVNRDLETAKKHAASYYKNVETSLLITFFNLAHFALGPETHIYYQQIAERFKDPKEKDFVSKAIGMIKQKAETNLGLTKTSLSQVANFDQTLTDDHNQFKIDFANQQTALSDLTQNVKDLNAKIDDLRGQIKSNNEAVAKAAIDEGLDLVKNGVSLALDAIDDNAADAIKTGAVMAFNFIKNDITIIVLELDTIKLIREVFVLSQELNEMENDLQILNNVGSMLQSLSDGGSFSTDSLETLDQFWQDLIDYLDSMEKALENGTEFEFFDPKLVTTTWSNTVSNPINDFMNADVPESPSQWVTGKVQFDSLDNIKKYI